MDVRNTLSINETFRDILVEYKEHGSKIAMLLDVDGVMRTEGFIKEIFWDDPIPFIKLTNGTQVVSTTIVAVNGIFTPSFSEC